MLSIIDVNRNVIVVQEPLSPNSTDAQIQDIDAFLRKAGILDEHTELAITENWMLEE